MWTELYIKQPKYDLSLYEQCLQDKVSEDGELLYKDEEHTYQYIGEDSNKKGLYYHSVTGVIKCFLPSFRGSTEKAQREMHLTDAQVKEVWEANRDYAGNRGTFIHAQLELMLTKGNVPTELMAKKPEKYILNEGELSLLAQTDDEVLSYRKKVKEWLLSLVENTPEKLHNKSLVEIGTCEKLLHIHSHNIAGQGDYMLTLQENKEGDTDGVKGKVKKILIDWKTNSKSLVKAYGFFKHPFTNIQNTLLNKFSFQLAMYSLMEEDMTGVPVNEAYVAHLIDGELIPHKIDLDKFKPLVKEMMEYYALVKK